ncbi:MAG: hypothetical protein JJE21_01625 [Spirochaetaceae bacterium]|nr:hypothetical protein [Spirochaetaceae bacterium]
MKNKICAIIKNKGKILMVYDSSSTEFNQFQFPKIEIKENEKEEFSFFSKMKEKYGVKGKTKDQIICIISHSYEEYELILHLIQIDLCDCTINVNTLDAKWLSINQIWKVPLAPTDVTVAQIIFEQN